MKIDFIFIKKVTQFLYRNIKNPVFLMLYIYRYFDKNFLIQASFFEDSKVLELISEGKSIIRLGDGELGLMTGRGVVGTVFTQKPLPLFIKKFKEIISCYTKDSPYILAIPKKYTLYSNEDLKRENKLRTWLPFKVMYTLYFQKSIDYADAHMFYRPKFFEEHIIPIISHRIAIFVINETKVESLKDKPIARSLHFVKTPPSEAGEQYEAIKEKIEKKIEELGVEKPLLLFSCGPVGKILLFEFALKGVQGIDVGEGANVLFESARIDYLV
jgi:hypothetical protein